MLEFTGERVIPGEVEPDLWNEHVSRYHFASLLAPGRVVADLGCGAGYGSAILARHANLVRGFDLSLEAIAWATDRYRLPNLHFASADCSAVPLDNGSMGLVVAFELIEHLPRPASLLQEARRILSPDGLFCVSTPNAAYYAASRGASGPNPFHAHEFSLAEFRSILADFFPHVTLLAQNHSPALSFQSMVENVQGIAEFEGVAAGEAHFLVAICSLRPLPQIPSFAYVPEAGNVLREREEHIARLEKELQQKQAWLDRSLAEHSTLVEAHRRLKTELEDANAWAKARDAELAEKSAHVEKLLLEAREAEDNAVELTKWARSLESDLAARTQWSLDLEAELEAKLAELARAVEVLHSTEAERDERTRWALSLEAQREALEAQLDAARQSRWLRLGRLLGLGPKLAP